MDEHLNYGVRKSPFFLLGDFDSKMEGVESKALL